MAHSNHNKQNSTSKLVKSQEPELSADELFTPECVYYRGEDIKGMRRELAGKRFTIASLEKVDFESGDKCVFLETKELERAFRVNNKNGRNLAEGFGNDLKEWLGREIAITATEYNTGWGVLMDPIVDEEAA